MGNQPHSWKSSLCQKLCVEEFSSLVPKHLFSFIETDASSNSHALANGDHVQGITEWMAPWRERQLSFGLDWSFNKENRMMTAHWSTVRTNAIVVDTADIDQGEDCLHLCIALMMTRVRWEAVVTLHLQLDQLH